MTLDNPLNFAITREDPILELKLMALFKLRNVLAVCSGGDTLLAIKEQYPESKICAFDINPHQLAHFKRKVTHSWSTINAMDELCRSGNFESLFRQWRLFFNEFILPKNETEILFLSGNQKELESIFRSKYWPVSFKLHFHDTFLEAMFGQAAIQHAPSGSYSLYFQKVFERGLKAEDFNRNPFLQHIFLDRFLEPPSYLKQKFSLGDFRIMQGSIFEVPDIEAYDLLQLSNIFDWSSQEEVKNVCAYLERSLAEGTVVLIRQINNESPVADFLGPCFKIYEDLGRDLQEQDRSLFYSKIVVAQKR